MKTSIQKGNSKLRPRARIIRTLGDELISNDVVAIIELVKNSYDAYASKVNITFTPPLTEGKGSIIVADDGSGMTLETIKTAWMEPATNFKRILLKGKKGRRILGEKGIGRFAAAKLADQLVMVTKSQDDNEVVVTFNWQDFRDEKKYLDEVACEWEVRQPLSIKKHGTILNLKGLASEWNEHKLRQLKVALSRLINPVSPVSDFQIVLDLPEKFKKLAGEISPPESLGEPDYRLTGSMTKNGQVRAVYFSKEMNRQEKIETPVELRPPRKPQCEAFSFEFRIWNRDFDSLRVLANKLESTLRVIQRDLNEAAGISVYRDYFRVLPYGESENDWLRLDMRRVQSPTRRLSNNQIVGYVAIGLGSNPELRDQSNREGIIESQALSDLRECIVFILSRIEIRRFKERRPQEPAHATPSSLFANMDITPVVEMVSEKLPHDTAARNLVLETESQIKEGVKKVQEVLARYRRLSTLGQLIDVVLHDGGNVVLSMDNELALLEKEFGRKTVREESVKEHIKLVQSEINVLAHLFKRLQPFGGRKRGRPKNFALEESIRSIFLLHNYLIEKLGVETSLPETETIVRLDESEFEIIIVNLLQNSLYWLENITDKRKIAVEVSQDDEIVTILFSDNGPGIKEEDAPYIFDPYFSTKPDGVGLGLTIVGELITEYNGVLDLVSDGPLDGATFRLNFRRRV